MTPSFALALQAADAAAAAQHYPQATLYVVATPIGNLADISLRALYVLQLADAIACEDTRHTRQMLQAYGIDKPGNALLAVHQHNERSASAQIIERLSQGQRVVYVSDAGTPGISDPGAIVVEEATRAGFRASPLPGASSVTAAMSAAGITQEGGYVFAGFLPAKGKVRQEAAQQLAAEPRAVVLLESPHRILDLAHTLQILQERPITFAREITKQFEQIHTLAAHAAEAWLTEDPIRQKGEFVVVIHPQPSTKDTTELPPEALRLLQLLLEEGVSLKSAVRVAAAHTNLSRNALYDAGLLLQKEISH
ncbi:16S rRNA (cytidine(1402)-2'-O)-methyltransferase [Lampropedia puyangensis]|uniref:Ribosomal RNA small subunit methyltransferase I n=1 Tax=Lampropedia puyangensis TaxID=1330072 RepID=A0A4S8F4K1_9BURK|nr:16S rRNA (cytidine(1402)-2'-O)-methyltransferase [Lampropedia puyangensis]THU01074.1 16S rRNA (cytidine(1402)-2'-O)-methyltransferase [Lampropedia puyangensis]